MASKPRLTQNILAMHRACGTNEGLLCSQCTHFQRFKQGIVWFNCAQAALIHGIPASWRAGWPACGRFRYRIGALVTNYPGQMWPDPPKD